VQRRAPAGSTNDCDAELRRGQPNVAPEREAVDRLRRAGGATRSPSRKIAEQSCAIG